MKKKLIVANWKMNCNLSEAKKLAEEIISGLRNFNLNNLEIVLCPPFTALSTIFPIIQSSNHPIIQLGAQNCHFKSCGAYTGEISPKMIANFCQYVILGHSERRKIFGEDDTLINKKIKASLEFSLKPIICVGEWKKGDSKEGILKQVKEAIKGLKMKEVKNLVFAYEPVWAIGTGEEADPSYANKICQEIKEVIVDVTNKEMASKIRILYGGSVDSSNILHFLKQKMIDGALVGGASLKAKEFIKIIRKANSI